MFGRITKELHEQLAQAHRKARDLAIELMQASEEIKRYRARAEDAEGLVRTRDWIIQMLQDKLSIAEAGAMSNEHQELVRAGEVTRMDVRLAKAKEIIIQARDGHWSPEKWEEEANGWLAGTT